MLLSMNDTPPELLSIITRRPPIIKEQRLSFGQSGLSVSDVQAMLGVLNPDMPYDDWLRVGMALHAEGFCVALWDSWSAQGSKYQTGECQDKWRGFDGSGGVSMGTLVHMTQEANCHLPNTPAPFLRRPETSSNASTPIHLIPWSELDKLPPRTYLIKGLLDQGGMSVVFGPSNSGKSFFALDLSCHVALNWPWQEKKVRGGAVAYIAGEGGLGISERLEAFRMHHKLKEYAPFYVIPTSVCLGKEAPLFEQLLTGLKGISDLKLVVIDTLARAMGSGDENSSGDMGAFIQNCDTLRQATGAHVMVIHHSGKDQGRGARGHSSLKAAIDTEIEISQTAGIVQATITKQREGPTDHAIIFELVPYEVGRDEDNEAMWSCALAPSSKSNNKEILTGQAREAFQVLLNLILESGFDHVPKSGMGTQKCVRLQDFKVHFTKAGIAETDNPESVSKAFLRAKNSLKTKGYIAEWDGHVWLLDKPDK